MPKKKTTKKNKNKNKKKKLILSKQIFQQTLA